MDSLPNILVDKLRALEAESDGRPVTPEAIGRALARAVPRTWKVSVYAAVCAGIPKADRRAFFIAFFDEQRLKTPKFKRTPAGEYIEDDEEEALAPRQLSWL